MCELAPLTNYMPIKNVVWSRDGRLVALADSTGRLAIDKVVRSGASVHTWDASRAVDLCIPLQDGDTINQLIFHPTSTKIFVATTLKIFSVEIESSTIRESVAEPESTSTLKVKWACYLTCPDTLLGFGNTKVHVFSWDGLRQTAEHIYFLPRLGRSLTTSVAFPTTYTHAASLQRDAEMLGRLITRADSPEVLLEISSTTPSGKFGSQYLLFDIRDLQQGGSEPGLPQVLGYQVMSSDIGSKIRQPLEMLSRKRLVFLSVERWICTWRLRTPGGKGMAGHGRSPSDIGGSAEVEQHYFLPGDWMTSKNTSLCTVTPGGTLLYPRNGGVVTVQAARLAK